jgi:hypothetical protein
MSYHNAVFSQRLKLVSRYLFETLAIKHRSGRSFRKAFLWSQFVTMALGGITPIQSLVLVA